MGGLDGMPYMDAADGLTRVMGSKKLYIRLLGSYTGNPRDTELFEAIEANDVEGTLRSAHAIKGIAANLSLLQLRQCMTDLEVLLKNGGASAFADVDKAAIKQVIDGTIDSVKAYVAAEQ